MNPRTQIDTIVRRAVNETLDVFKQVLGAETESAEPTRRAPRAAKKTVAKTTRAAKKTVVKKRAVGQKRDPKDIADIQKKLEDYIRANPGQRVEVIGKTIKVSTKELNLPLKKLKAAGTIIATGEKRATEYNIAPGK